MGQTKTNAWRICVAVAVTACAVGMLACGGRAQRVRNRRMMVYEHQLLRHAQRDTGCPAQQLTPQQINQEPPVYTFLGCDQPVEYWLMCDHRAHCRPHDVPRLNNIASGALACPPGAIQQQPTQNPTMRYATGCGRTAPFTIQCGGGGCSWQQTGPAQGAGGGAYAGPPPPQQPPQQVIVTEPPAQGPAPAATLQTQVQTQREAILSCIDDATLVLRLRWTADGQVIIQLPPELAGTAAEGCIQAAIGALRVSAQQAGEVEVPLQ